MSFIIESAGGNLLGFFLVFFLCLPDQIFRVLLEHFISEVVSK